MPAKKILPVFCAISLGALLTVGIYSTHSLPLKFFLIGLFLVTGYFVRRNLWHGYLAFVFLYPLIPSHPQLFGTGAFQYAEFLFVSFSFWWSVTRFQGETVLSQQKWLIRLAWLLISVVFISCLMAILRDNLIFTQVFLLKLKEQLNIFTPWSPRNMLFSVQTAVHLAEGLLFLMMTVDIINRRERIVITVKTMLFSATIVAVLGILQYFFRFELLAYWVRENPNIVRIHSTMDDPNSLGTYLATLLCIGVFAFLAPGVLKNRKVYFICFALILLALAMTVSRAALGAVFVVLFLLPLVATLLPAGSVVPVLQTLKRFSKWGWIAIGLFLLLVLVAYFVNVTNRQPTTVVEVVLYTLNPSLPLNEVLKGRLDLWKSAFLVFTKFPLMGCGPGMSPVFLNEYPFNAITGATQENVHNYFLQLLTETGVIGFTLFLFVQVQVICLGLRNIRNPDNGPMLFAIFCGWTAFLITSITGHPLLLPKMQFLFWGICGLLIAAPVLHSSTSIERSTKDFDRKFVILAAGGLVIVTALGVHSVFKNRDLSSYEYGYYRWEQDSDGRFFRWTRNEALSIVKAQGKILNLSFRYFNRESIGEKSNVEIYVNERLVDRIPVRNITWKDWEFYLPEIKMNELVFIKIKPEITFRPVEFGSPDRRILGIAMRNIEWKCSADVSESGVYEWENAGGRIFRWTTKQSSFFLTPQKSHLIFSMLPNRTVLSKPIQAEFFWNDHRIHQIEFTGIQWQPVALQIPDQATGPGVLTIRASSTWNPFRNEESDDNRDLGLAITVFAWEGLPVPERGSAESILTGQSHLVGIFNHQDELYRLVYYRIGDKKLSEHVKILRNGSPLSYDSGLNFSSDQKSEEQIIYPKGKEHKSLAFFTPSEFTDTVRLTAGKYLVRMKARATFGGIDPPLLGVRWNGHGAGGQPIVSSDWQNYFYEVSCLKNGEQKINVKYLNDFYDPVNRLDRNVFIQEISVVRVNANNRALTGSEAASRWSFRPDTQTVFITEPADDSIFPLRYCYTIKNP